MEHIIRFVGCCRYGFQFNIQSNLIQFNFKILDIYAFAWLHIVYHKCLQMRYKLFVCMPCKMLPLRWCVRCSAIIINIIFAKCLEFQISKISKTKFSQRKKRPQNKWTCKKAAAAAKAKAKYIWLLLRVMQLIGFSFHSLYHWFYFENADTSDILAMVTLDPTNVTTGQKNYQKNNIINKSNERIRIKRTFIEIVVG